MAGIAVQGGLTAYSTRLVHAISREAITPIVPREHPALHVVRQPL